MPTPEDQKAEKCPFCDEKPITHEATAACCNHACPAYLRWVSLDQWNTRPREKVLEDALEEANRVLRNCKGWHLGDKWRNSDQAQERNCWEGQLERIEKALSAINAALEEKR